MPGLFDPLTIRGLTLKNRIVMPPMATRLSPPDGSVTEQHIAHYVARARAGVGLIIVEHSYIARNGRNRETQLGVYADHLIPGLRRLVEAIRAAGAATCLQLNHAGANTYLESAGEHPVGPSDVPVPARGVVPRPLSRDEIRDIVKAFGEAADRALAAGFDAVEIHGAHGYLLSQFASPLTNRRTDEYGGDLWHRFRLPLEVVREVRSRLPSDRPLFYRLGADDFLPGGLTLDDTRQVAPHLVAAGVDVLDVSGGLGGSGSDLFTEEGYLIQHAHRIKEASGAIVIGIGNIRDPRFADRVVREGLVDLVAVGRGQLDDPEWAAKAAQALASAG